MNDDSLSNDTKIWLTAFHRFCTSCIVLRTIVGVYIKLFTIHLCFARLTALEEDNNLKNHSLLWEDLYE